jgi:hypothetical protein
MKSIIHVLAVLSLAVGALSFPAASAQTAIATSAISTQGARPAEGGTWSNEQLLTSTVHSAWVLSNRNEKNFADMVKALIPLASLNRGITLPDDAETGALLGRYVKAFAKADQDQLLFVVVDRAVVKTAHAKK